MDSRRAKEIFDSLGVIEVLHRGAAVWIENVDDRFADIKYLTNNSKSRVPVSELVETGS